MVKIKVIEINSLSKYIRCINQLENISYYRGEKEIYSVRQSSALRPYEFRWNSTEPYPFVKMIDEFYRETAYKLNEDRSDFIAFAQHYGIPTNLLDITTSPLAALYFACQGDEKSDGVVYVCSNEYIDVTDLIHQYPNQNLIEAVFSSTPNKLTSLVPLFTKFKIDYPENFAILLKELIRSYLSYFFSSFDDKEKQLHKKLKQKNIDVWECIACIRDAFENINEFPLDTCDGDIYLYLALQFVFFKKAVLCSEPISSISFLPNMVYRPVIKFERGRNQQGLFLYQGYLSYIDEVYDFRVLIKQHLFFQNTEFRIKNKAMVLSELDKIGINKKNIFCDFDSIAQYITEKYK